MAKPILDDHLWKIIEPALPQPKRRRKKYPGRKVIGAITQTPIATNFGRGTSNPSSPVEARRMEVGWVFIAGL